MQSLFRLDQKDLVVGGTLYSLKIDKENFELPQSNMYEGRYSFDGNDNQELKLISIDDSITMVKCIHAISESIFITGDYVLGRSIHDIFEKIRVVISKMSDTHVGKSTLCGYMVWVYTYFPEYIV